MLKRIVIGPVLLFVLVLVACKPAAPVADFTVDPSEGGAPVEVTFADASTNEPTAWSWDFGDGETSTDASPSHRYEKTGTYDVTLEVTNDGGTDSITKTAAVTVNPGPLDRVEFASTSTATIDLAIGETHDLSVRAFDAQGNEIEDLDITWTASDSDEVSDTRTFTAGSQAGNDSFATASVSHGGVERELTQTFAILPGPLDKVEIQSVDGAIPAGALHSFAYVATDEHGNVLTPSEATWDSNETAGSITSTGSFRASGRLGSYTSAVRVSVELDGVTKRDSANVTITTGRYSQTVHAPALFELGVGMTQQLVVRIGDSFGNIIDNPTVTWSTSDGGTITRDGLFTAGDVPGVYEEAITARIVSGEWEATAPFTVIVVPDRIAFVSDRGANGFFQVFTTDATTSSDDSALQLTSSLADKYAPRWSPGGRRLIYWGDGEGTNPVIGDDGKWKVVPVPLGIYSDRVEIPSEPDWSPDGTRIVYVVTSIGIANGEINFADTSREIYVADIDGSNITQLTDTPFVDEWVPSWSSDGTKIVYDATPDGSFGDIWIMNADGTDAKFLYGSDSNEPAHRSLQTARRSSSILLRTATWRFTSWTLMAQTSAS